LNAEAGNRGKAGPLGSRIRPAQTFAMPSSPLLRFVALLSASALAACAHGEPAAPRAPAAATASADATCGLPRFQAELLERINQFRATPRRCGARSFAAAEPLRWNAPLAQAAARHATDMARSGTLSHTGSDGRDMDERVEAAGYAWSTVGENVAGGPNTVQAVMAGWQKSEGHCANLMNPAFRDVGVACVPAVQRRPFDTYWAMSLGRSR
jgi:uncharacterized protein YkwD